MKLTEEIREAIRKAVKREGSQFALCKKVGISISIMSRYLKGNVKTINAGTWNMIYPFIQDYLPEDKTEPNSAAANHYTRAKTPIALRDLTPEFREYLCDTNARLRRVYIPLSATSGMREEAPSDAELEILKRDAKLAQLRLQIAYLERKVKRLQDLNFKETD